MALPRLKFVVTVMALVVSGFEHTNAGWLDGNCLAGRTGQVLAVKASVELNERDMLRLSHFKAGMPTKASGGVQGPKDCASLCLVHDQCHAWNFIRNDSVEAAAMLLQLPTKVTLQAVRRQAASRPLCVLLRDEGEQVPSQNLLKGEAGAGSKEPCPLASGVKRAMSQELQPLKYKPFQLGTVAPAGWLRNQLIIMANGLSGHLDLFWKDVNNSVWIGGTDDKSGAGHERGPYWLNGMVPLVMLLRASGDIEKLDTDIQAQVEYWVTYIIDHQLPNGWLGPDDGFGGTGNTYWSGWNVAAALIQYASASFAEPQLAARCKNATLAYIQEVYRRMQKTPTQSWSQNRWQDWVYIIHMLMDLDAMGQEQMLWDAAELTKQQSWDWNAYYHEDGIGSSGAYIGQPVPSFPHANVSAWTMWDHGVNNAMGTKSGAVWYRQSGNDTEAQESYHKLFKQRLYHGQPHGMFSADECFGGRALNRGIELCAVVEQMYSLQAIFQIQGDGFFLDSCERIAFNALPGTITPDMWQHQYLQQANEITAAYGIQQHVWQTDGPDSTGFGVEPNFGCCTANMQQGWPKFANNILYLTESHGDVVLGMFAPVSATYNGVRVVVQTEYPFGDDVTVSVKGSMPGKSLFVRIPGWATNANVSVNSADPVAVSNGTFFQTGLDANETTVVLNLNPSIRIETGWGINRTSSEVPYSPQGATVPSQMPDWSFTGGAGSAASKMTGATDIRSGNPNETTTAQIDSLILSQGHTLTNFSFSFQYVAGYTPPQGQQVRGSTMSAVLVNASSGDVVATLYQSPVLDKYSYDDFTTYSPPINVTASDLNISTHYALLFQLRLVNNDRNLQIAILPDRGLNCTVTWSSKVTPGPTPPIPPQFRPTNAATLVRGPLVYSLFLNESSSVVRTWSPFNNSDVNFNSTTPFNLAIVVNDTLPPVFARHGAPGVIPFDTHNFPSTIQAHVRQLPSWRSSMQAADEPPPSPVNCKTETNQGRGCGNLELAVFVPYGATNLRMAALPWVNE